MLRELNKETITFVLNNEFNFSDREIYELVESVWNSDERLQDIQSAEQRINPTKTRIENRKR